MKNINNNKIVSMTKDHFFDIYNASGDNNPYPEHVTMVEEIVIKMLAEYPNADKEVVLLSVWLHDIGSFLGERSIHEINSEKEVRKFLPTLGVSVNKIEKVAHCVRAHRCGDVKPSTIEAKILAVADSASHLYAGPYINMKEKFDKVSVLEKLERDYRDIGLLPKTKKELAPLYKAWKRLLELLPD